MNENTACPQPGRRHFYAWESEIYFRFTSRELAWAVGII